LLVRAQVHAAYFRAELFKLAINTCTILTYRGFKEMQLSTSWNSDAECCFKHFDTHSKIQVKVKYAQQNSS